MVGDVIGFARQWERQEHGVLWISGDTVFYDSVRQVADRLQVDTALLHLGGVRFPTSGPVRYTMTAKEAGELCGLVRAPSSRSTTRGGSTFAKGERQSNPSSPMHLRTYGSESGGCRSASRPRWMDEQACNPQPRRTQMGTITTKDGTEIFYKDWGEGQPVVFSHGWPLNADAWDDQSFLVVSNGLSRHRA